MPGKNNEAFKRLEEVFAAGRDANEDRVESVRVLVAVDRSAHRDFVLSIKEAFMPARNGVFVDVLLVEDVAEDPDGAWDACVVVAGGSDEVVERAAVGVGRRGNPVVIVGQSVLDIPESCLVEPLSAFVATIAASNASSLKNQLADWLMRATNKQTALAASFPFCRSARVRELTQACAAQNAAIGIVNLLPGSDMPYITVNQAKLAVDIAAVYGRSFSVARAPELVAVAVLGLTYRAAARILTGAIPVLNRVMRGVTAYLGTMSTSRLVTARFDLAEGRLVIDPEEIRNDIMSGVASVRDGLPELKDRLADYVDLVSGIAGRAVDYQAPNGYDDYDDQEDYEDVAPEAPRDYIVFTSSGDVA